MNILTTRPIIAVRVRKSGRKTVKTGQSPNLKNIFIAESSQNLAFRIILGQGIQFNVQSLVHSEDTANKGCQVSVLFDYGGDLTRMSFVFFFIEKIN